ncbi:DUF2118 domain-containing protein [Methanococcus voltae]|uniref:Uncharacterized protein n=2 Tax=Methanococcus voltae TaxID=2188 RepID=A0A8J7RHS7_METVO|nr:DUF2118 domain-containing protein [Methanococcus voltae]MBP2173238.1 hypothetical protein [Methanococcus voltae]MBP2202102.1 hypothetical protein [Methanococcus voltae]MCS3922915.1 hypothetical protein [Methanococcus voltae PS]
MKISKIYVENEINDKNKSEEKIVISENQIIFLNAEEDINNYKNEYKIFYKVRYDDIRDYIDNDVLKKDIFVKYPGNHTFTYIKAGTFVTCVVADSKTTYPVLEAGSTVLQDGILATLKSKKGVIRYLKSPVSGTLFFMNELFEGDRSIYIFAIVENFENL